MKTPGPVTAWLERAHPAAFSAFAIAGAFTTYFSMYAFRKPFAVGTFEGAVELPGLPPMDLKILFIISQVVGYCLSKFIGIKVISEMSPAKRAVAILGVIGVAEAALVLFAVIPAPYNAAAMFINGLPLGMVWGLVFGFLEGRKVSEVLGVGLSASYILASGVVKSVGKWVMSFGVAETSMPFATGLLFVPLLLLGVWMLSQLPPPTAEDEAARTRRVPMDSAARWAFVRSYAPGLAALTGLYILLTAFRDFRDNFAREIWDALGYADSPEVFTLSELPVTVAVLAALALIMVIKDNRKALIVVHVVMAGGTLIIGLSTLAFQMGIIGGAAFMVLVGLGAYLAYVPYGCILFDRLIATLGTLGTAGFMIYMTDAFGYLGSVALLLYKNFGHAELSWLDFFIQFSYANAALCTVAFLVSGLYFARLTRPKAAQAG